MDYACKIKYFLERIMALYVIADLHLSTENAAKSMEVFGNRWQDYQNKIKRNWNKLVTESDTVIVPGDVSWALSLEDAMPDLKFLDTLNGKKLLMKGNHDFWWTSLTKMRNLFEAEGITSIDFLYNNAVEVEGYILTGSRGWFVDPSIQTKNVNADFEKINNRELIRLKIGLDAAKELQGENDTEIIAFFHFPLMWGDFKNEKMIDLLREYGITRSYFGHIHGNYYTSGNFEHNGLKMRLISADFLDFVPLFVQ